MSGTTEATPPAPRRILIVDARPETRVLLRRRLGMLPGVEVVGEGANGAEAITLVYALAPDVVVLDLEMSVASGDEAVPKMRSIAPGIRILLYTGAPDEAIEAIPEASRPDVIVRKGGALIELVDGLKTLMEAGPYDVLRLELSTIPLERAMTVFDTWVGLNVRVFEALARGEQLSEAQLGGATEEELEALTGVYAHLGDNLQKASRERATEVTPVIHLLRGTAVAARRALLAMDAGRLRDFYAAWGYEVPDGAVEALAEMRDTLVDTLPPTVLGEDDEGKEAESLARQDEHAVERAAEAVERVAAAGDRTAAGVDRTAAEEARTSAVEARESAATDRTDAAADRASAATDRTSAATDRTASDAARESAAGDRTAAAGDRADAADDRADAAEDRSDAAEDRAAAATDRIAAATDRAAATSDALTGAYLRGPGHGEVKREIARAKRTKQPLTLVFLDVDGLKKVNDSRDHETGDKLLREVAGVLKSQLREYDVIVRHGGDEFICALPGMGMEQAEERIQMVHDALASTEEQWTVSAGFAALKNEDSLESLVARADRALYARREKKRGTGKKGEYEIR